MSPTTAPLPGSAGIITETVRIDRVGESATVHRAGDAAGTPVIFLHGAAPGASGLSNWRLALQALSDEFQCIAPDFFGFAASWHPADPPRDMRLWNRLRVEQVLGLMEHHGWDKAHLVGSSMGASVAMQLLMEAPEKFDRAVLMATAGTPAPVTGELERVMDFYLDPSAAALARLYSWFVHDPDAMPVDLGALAQKNYEVATRTDVRRSFTAQFASGPPVGIPESALRRIGSPVLVVHGQGDRVVPVAAAHYLCSLIPDVRLHVFGQCGHWIPSEHPERLHHLLRSFLTGQL